MSRDLKQDCTAPLVIVPDRSVHAWWGQGRVVVGVDGRPGGDAAFAWAAEEARIHRVPLEVVAAWSTVESPLPPGTPRGMPYREAMSRAATGPVQRLVTGRTDPEPSIVRTIVEGPAAGALLDRAAEAQLLVLGTRGRARDILRGSVRQACLRRSTVPVAIIR